LYVRIIHPSSLLNVNMGDGQQQDGPSWILLDELCSGDEEFAKFKKEERWWGEAPEYHSTNAAKKFMLRQLYPKRGSKKFMLRQLYPKRGSKKQLKKDDDDRLTMWEEESLTKRENSVDLFTDIFLWKGWVPPQNFVTDCRKFCPEGYLIRTLDDCVRRIFRSEKKAEDLAGALTYFGRQKDWTDWRECSTKQKEDRAAAFIKALTWPAPPNFVKNCQRFCPLGAGLPLCLGDCTNLIPAEPPGPGARRSRYSRARAFIEGLKETEESAEGVATTELGTEQKTKITELHNLWKPQMKRIKKAMQRMGGTLYCVMSQGKRAATTLELKDQVLLILQEAEKAGVPKTVVYDAIFPENEDPENEEMESFDDHVKMAMYVKEREKECEAAKERAIAAQKNEEAANGTTGWCSDALGIVCTPDGCYIPAGPRRDVTAVGALNGALLCMSSAVCGAFIAQHLHKGYIKHRRESDS